MNRLIAILFLFCVNAAVAGLSDQERWQFEVLLDEKKIGYHDFLVSEKDGKQTVSSEARFNVKLFFVNIYSYRHQTEEVWRDNCLSAIEAETAANGKDFLVRGKADAGEFKILTESNENELPPCIMTFAYWNPKFLKADSLLNSQTGDYENVSIDREGEEVLQVNGLDIRAIRYSVNGAAAPITLWYAAADHRWLALESMVNGGRVLRYKPVSLPESMPGFLAAGE